MTTPVKFGEWEAVASVDGLRLVRPAPAGFARAAAAGFAFLPWFLAYWYRPVPVVLEMPDNPDRVGEYAVYWALLQVTLVLLVRAFNRTEIQAGKQGIARRTYPVPTDWRRVPLVDIEAVSYWQNWTRGKNAPRRPAGWTVGVMRKGGGTVPLGWFGGDEAGARQAARALAATCAVGVRQLDADEGTGGTHGLVFLGALLWIAGSSSLVFVIVAALDPR